MPLYTIRLFRCLHLITSRVVGIFLIQSNLLFDTTTGLTTLALAHMKSCFLYRSPIVFMKVVTLKFLKIFDYNVFYNET